VNNQFVGWQESFANFDIDPKLQYHEVMVPTIDSTRNIFITKILLNNKFHVMCPGPTGTGKSLNLYTLLGKEMGDDFQYVALTFSA
jgi:dynein heavy chain